MSETVKKTSKRIKIWKGIWLTMAMLCALYAVMVYLVGSGTKSFLIWVVGVLVFFFLFLKTGTGAWKRLPIGVKTLICMALCAGLNIFILCQVAILSGMTQHGEPNLDYIVVLGAQMRDHGPSIVYKHRLDAAYQYLMENPETKCICTGGQGSNESISEGEGGKNYLIAKGIDPDRIISETTSVSTKENIQNAIPLILGDKLDQVAGAQDTQEETMPDVDGLTLGIVTNNYHVFRGVKLAEGILAKEKEKWQVCGIAAYMEPQFLPNNMVRETFGILKDLL